MSNNSVFDLDSRFCAILDGKKVYNLTPHLINIRGDRTLDLDTSGIVARCSQSNELVGRLAGISIKKQKFGKVVDLPDPQENTIYIVSRLVADACRDRNDLLIPGPVLRDENGKVIGCDGLSIL